jgi:L-cysteine S-thiosulfotransferase
MRGFIKVAVVSVLAAGGAASLEQVTAGENLPEGVTVISVKPAAKDSPFEEVISGWKFRAKETRKLQQDDFDNPGYLWVDKGEDLWNKVEGKAGKSCAACHDDASVSMKGVGAAMPKWDAKLGRPLTMEQRINVCRTDNMEAKPWKWESDQMLSMTSYVKNQSRGMPVNVQADGPMEPWVKRGKELYYTRVGQLNMSCANCHEANFGKYIRADYLSQGQSNGFPTYRLKWQKVGSLHRRFKGCMKNIRAKPYKRGSDEFVSLEIYLAQRGKGLQIESPAVRN